MVQAKCRDGRDRSHSPGLAKGRTARDAATSLVWLIRRHLWALMALAALSLAWGPASANDSSAQLGTGGLVLTTNAGVAMQSEDLRISVKSIDIDYVFLNEGDTDVTTIVAFPLPKLSGNDEDFTVQLPRENDPLDFIGFRIEVDGKPIAPQVEQRASVLGLDITDRLKADRVPVNPFTRSSARDALAKLPKDKRDFYIQHGLAAWIDGQPASVQWDVATTYYWLQTFPAKKPVKVHHSYHPVAGSALLSETSLSTPETMGELVKTYCLDKSGETGLRKALAALGQKAPGAGAVLSETRVDYVLSTGANWSGPIGAFKLSIEKPAPDMLMSLCFPGKLQKVSPTQFVFTAKDFTPAQDLSILLVNLAATP